MNNATPRIFLVGSPTAFEFVHNLLEQTESYTVDLASTSKTARFFLRREPAVIILHLPASKEETEHRLDNGIPQKHMFLTDSASPCQIEQFHRVMCFLIGFWPD